MDIDTRLTQLSHSSRCLLHSCPRKYQLRKIASRPYEDDPSTSCTLNYGTIFGLGIQCVMERQSEQQVILAMFLAWQCDLLLSNEKQNKSFWLAVLAVQKFAAMVAEGYLDEYELMYHEGKPACELGFKVTLPDGFSYRGFVDIVLRNKVTGALMILEVKTTSANYVNAATYKNSGQAIGYSIVLDVVAPDASSYDVTYLVYFTKLEKFETMTFPKSYTQRAQWIQEVLLDAEIIRRYEDIGVYPAHGESCVSFGRECEFFSVCGMSTAMLMVAPPEAKETDDDKFEIKLSIHDLVRAQLDKVNN